MATDSARRFAPTAADSAPTATDPSRHRRPPLRPDYRRAAPICIPRAAAPASRCFRRILADLDSSNNLGGSAEPPRPTLGPPLDLALRFYMSVKLQSAVRFSHFDS
ncbi:hypothetical protein GUJ93_ZPchr0013g34999 [Zizania palustris]|uniref:Uncharacterized protein n=1 Tax=Zizania palustris TaxID=103762 RepID=A0A8J5WW82_ZIZPA|nr:hypothetical protein GUJ93_ZPchr0013g34999 [Zizania palustris]